MTRGIESSIDYISLKFTLPDNFYSGEKRLTISGHGHRFQFRSISEDDFNAIQEGEWTPEDSEEGQFPLFWVTDSLEESVSGLFEAVTISDGDETYHFTLPEDLPITRAVVDSHRIAAWDSYKSYVSVKADLQKDQLEARVQIYDIGDVPYTFLTFFLNGEPIVDGDPEPVEEGYVLLSDDGMETFELDASLNDMDQVVFSLED